MPFRLATKKPMCKRACGQKKTAKNRWCSGGVLVEGRNLPRRPQSVDRNRTFQGPEIAQTMRLIDAIEGYIGLGGPGGHWKAPG